MSAGAILTINAGSSSVKFSIYAEGDEPQELCHGQVENLGPAAQLELTPVGGDRLHKEIGRADHASAMVAILDHLRPVLGGRSVLGVGHRIVHGGPRYGAPVPLTRAVLDELTT